MKKGSRRGSGHKKSGRKKGQTPAQHRASLRNLALAREAKRRKAAGHSSGVTTAKAKKVIAVVKKKTPHGAKRRMKLAQEYIRLGIVRPVAMHYSPTRGEYIPKAVVKRILAEGKAKRMDALRARRVAATESHYHGGASAYAAGMSGYVPRRRRRR